MVKVDAMVSVKWKQIYIYIYIYISSRFIYSKMIKVNMRL